mmetsp:Transcript_27018/g.89319  ORF Transcript_27018/g.89319 Transcript_27018/m.89319 type:complete len:229 (+) Transcript_27018:53-739(+)
MAALSAPRSASERSWDASTAVSTASAAARTAATLGAASSTSTPSKWPAWTAIAMATTALSARGPASRGWRSAAVHAAARTSARSSAAFDDASASASSGSASTFVADASSRRSRLPTPRRRSAAGRVSVPTSAPTPTRWSDADASTSKPPSSAAMTSTWASPMDVSMSQASDRRFWPLASARRRRVTSGAATPILPSTSSVSFTPRASRALSRSMMDARAPAATKSSSA